MLTSLRIENVAVIEKVQVQFTAGLNVLTGETGAGKSILIDSISAILGNRISRDLVRTGAPKACIWATFDQLPKQVKMQLEQTPEPLVAKLGLFQPELSEFIDRMLAKDPSGRPGSWDEVADFLSAMYEKHKSSH